MPALVLFAGACDRPPVPKVGSETAQAPASDGLAVPGGGSEGDAQPANPAMPVGETEGQAPPPPAQAQAAPTFTAEQLEQLVAPIALYPDPLLMDVLMAATYPAEVAEAAAWVKEHPGMNGKALDDAIADKGWDVSVNSLTHATQAIELMGSDAQWTGDLGEAFLAQQDDVLNAVQVMRSRACDAGNLKTNEHLKVDIEQAPPRPVAQPARQYVVAPPPRIVHIVPAQPELLYVPVYNPRIIYGPPPPVLFYPRAYVYPAIAVGIAPIISFGVGLTIGSLFWSDLDWHEHHVYGYRYGGYPRYGYARDYQPEPWRHDVYHRRGVAYRTPYLQERYRYADGGDHDRHGDWSRDRQGADRAGDAYRSGQYDRGGDRGAKGGASMGRDRDRGGADVRGGGGRHGERGTEQKGRGGAVHEGGGKRKGGGHAAQGDRGAQGRKGSAEKGGARSHGGGKGGDHRGGPPGGSHGGGPKGGSHGGGGARPQGAPPASHGGRGPSMERGAAPGHGGGMHGGGMPGGHGGGAMHGGNRGAEHGGGRQGGGGMHGGGGGGGGHQGGGGGHQGGGGGDKHGH